MGVKWTPEQESAIMSPKDSNLGAQTLLVAAAAGSGKTAVLVERIITRLKDMENPLSVQELMVVTFTKAAAAEMSARIGVALAKAMESTDDKALQARLERQLNLLPSAHISTLHSFCQWVIRSYLKHSNNCIDCAHYQSDTRSCNRSRNKEWPYSTDKEQWGIHPCRWPTRCPP